MNAAERPLTFLGQVARLFALAMFGYWGVYALVAPVTTIDSQMYNLARLELAERGGLFNNDYFTSVFHVLFPWSYDAVHLPFLHLGWGCVLPSYFCLVGTGYVVFTLLRARFGRDAAWVGMLGLLALPCLVYQGASTKNDIPLLFCGAVWVFARWRWRQDGRRIDLFWMVMAIGFMAGAKTSGVIDGFLLALWTLWEVRQDHRLVLRVAGGLVGAGLLFGSGETYVETARIYGHPFGPPPLIHRLGNHDGVRGGLATLIRNLGAGVYAGPADFRDEQLPAAGVSAATRRLLGALGLTDAGTDPRFRDETLYLTQSGMEELSGFGPVGTLAVAAMLIALVWWRPRERWWQLAVAGLFGLGVVSLTVAYNPWMNRYVIGWYALGTLAVVCALWQRDSVWRGSVRWLFVVVAAGSAVAAPLLSFNRRPADIVAAVRARERLETSTYPIAGRVRESLREWHRRAPAARVFFVASDEAVILPILEDRALNAILVTPAQFQRLAAAGKLAVGDLVTQEGDGPLPGVAKVEKVTAPNVFVAGGTVTQWIYRVVSSGAGNPGP